MKNIAVMISRLIVGALFIVSGLIKANDSLGFSYKLVEYFGERALGLEGLIPYALGLAIFICIAEVLLGVALLLGALPKLTNALLLVMILFFTWLTYYTKSCDNEVKQEFTNSAGEKYMDYPDCVLACGCFGNAIPLTPEESFYKDLFLLFFIIITVLGAFVFKNIKLNTSKEDIIYVAGSLFLIALFSMGMLDWTFPVIFTAGALGIAILVKRYVNVGPKEIMMALGVVLVCSWFQYHTLNHLPIKDYRAYAIGLSIPEGMLTAEELGLDPPKYVNIYDMKNETTGETKTLDSDQYMQDPDGSGPQEPIWKDKSWKIVETRGPKKIKDGYEPLIPDFTIMNPDGDTVQEELLTGGDYVFLHIAYSLDNTCSVHMPEMTAFADAAMKDGHRFYGLTSSGDEKVADYRHEHQCKYDFLSGDEKVLKTVVRSNPGLVVLKDGVVVNKWHIHDIPDYAESSAKGFNP